MHPDKIKPWPTNDILKQDQHVPKGPWKEELKVSENEVVWEIHIPGVEHPDIILEKCYETILLTAPYTSRERVLEGYTSLDLKEDVTNIEASLELGILSVAMQRPSLFENIDVVSV